MMVEYNILYPKFFIKHSQTIADFLYEGMIEFSKGIRIVGLDPSRISVLELKMGIDSVETNNIRKFNAPINLDSFSKIVNRFSDPEDLKIIYDEGNNKVTVRGKINNKTKTFNLSTITLDNSDWKDPIPNLSKIPYNVVFKIRGSDIRGAVDDAALFAEVFTISTKDNIVTISATGQSGSCESTIEIPMELYGKETASYSINYFKRMMKGLNQTEIVVMLKSDYPLAIYDMLTGKSHMLYYLAPRVENDDL